MSQAAVLAGTVDECCEGQYILAAGRADGIHLMYRRQMAYFCKI